jgi:hypothetical protein
MNINEEQAMPGEATQEQPEQSDSVLQFFSVEEQHPIRNDYRRVGFYQAVAAGDNIGDSLDHLIQDQNSETEKRILAFENNNDLVIAGVDDGLFKIQERIDAQKKRLQEVREGRSEMETEAAEVKGEIDSLTQDHKNLIIQLGERHRDMIKLRLETVRSELDNLVETYNKVYEAKYQNENELKAALKSQRDYYQELKTQLQGTYEKVKDKLDVLYPAGVGPFSTNFLMTVGFAASIAAAFLFGLFSVEEGLDRQNVFLFFFEGAFNFADIFVEKYGALQAAFLMVALVLILFLVITFLVWGCQYLLDRYTNDRSWHNLGVKMKGNRSRFNSSIRARSLFSFWLQLLPWLFTAAIVFIIVAVGQSNGTIKTLLPQLTGQTIGLAIVLLCAGLFFLYVIKVVEPAAEKRTSEGRKSSSRWRINPELIIGIIILNVLLLILIFSDVIVHSNSAKFNAIVGYAALVNLTAITLAYALRHKNLLGTRYHLERRVSDLTELLVSLSSTKPMKVWLTEEKQFSKRFLKLQDELLQLMESKTRNLNRLDKWSGNLSRDEGKKRGLGDLIRRLKAVVRSKEASVASDRELMRFRRINFPELSYQIDQLERALQNQKSEYESLLIKMKKVDEHNSDIDWDVKGKLEALRRQHRIQLNSKMSFLDQKMQTRLRLTRECKQAEAQLREGFLLGTWLQKNIL